jgi:hypothetical protein
MTQPVIHNPLVYPIVLPSTTGQSSQIGNDYFFNSDLLTRPVSQCSWIEHEIDTKACDVDADDDAKLITQKTVTSDCIEIYVTSQGESGLMDGPIETGNGTATSPYINLNSVTNGCTHLFYLNHCCNYPMIKVIVSGTVDYYVQCGTTLKDRMLIDFAGASLNSDALLPNPSISGATVFFYCVGYIIMSNMTFSVARNDDYCFVTTNVDKITLNNCNITSIAGTGNQNILFSGNLLCADNVTLTCSDIDLSTDKYESTLRAKSAHTCIVNIECAPYSTLSIGVGREVLAFDVAYAESCTVATNKLSCHGAVTATGFNSFGTKSKKCVASVYSNYNAYGWKNITYQDGYYSSEGSVYGCTFNGAVVGGSGWTTITAFKDTNVYSSICNIDGKNHGTTKINIYACDKCYVYNSEINVYNVKCDGDVHGIVALFHGCAEINGCTGTTNSIEGRHTETYGVDSYYGGFSTSHIIDSVLTIKCEQGYGFLDTDLIQNTIITLTALSEENSSSGGSCDVIEDSVVVVNTKARGRVSISGISASVATRTSITVNDTSESSNPVLGYGSAEGARITSAIDCTVDITTVDKSTTVFIGAHMVNCTFTGYLNASTCQCYSTTGHTHPDDIFTLGIVGCNYPLTCINSSVSVGSTPVTSYKYSYIDLRNLSFTYPVTHSYAIGCSLWGDQSVPVDGLTCSGGGFDYGRPYGAIARNWYDNRCVGQTNYPLPTNITDCVWYGCIGPNN